MVSVTAPRSDQAPDRARWRDPLRLLADIARTQTLTLTGLVLMVVIASARVGVYILITGAFVDAFISSDGAKAFRWVVAFLVTNLVEELYWTFKPVLTAVITDYA